MRKHTV